MIELNTTNNKFIEDLIASLERGAAVLALIPEVLSQQYFLVGVTLIDIGIQYATSKL